MEQEEWEQCVDALSRMDEGQLECIIGNATSWKEVVKRSEAKKDGKVLLQVSKDGKYVTVAEQDYIKGEEV